MLHDTFLFFNELDLLEMRLTELDSVVDRFVICESTRTFQGAEKPLYFQRNRHMFDRWQDKIIHVVYDSPDRDCSSWEREKAQRDEILKGLRKGHPNDLILISDVDEIPHPDDLAAASPPARFVGPMCYYFLNCQAVNYQLPGPKLYRACLMKRPSSARYGKNPTKGRQWHFSYLGGVEAIQTKLLAFSHTEYATDEWTDPVRIERAIAEHKDLFDRRFKYKIVPIDETFPKCVQHNPERWKKYICPVSSG